MDRRQSRAAGWPPGEPEGHGLVESVALSREEQGDEFLLMGLRLREGIDPRAFEKLTWPAILTKRELRA